MFDKFFRHRKYKKMIKVSSSFILAEFAKIINETIEHFEKEGRIKSPEQKEVLKFETIAFVIWLFQTSDIFLEPWCKLILDEVHNQYFERLRKHGYDSKMRQLVCDDFALRYKTYSDIMREGEDFTRVCAKFIRFLSERSKTDLDIRDLVIPLYLIQKLTPKFEEFRKVTGNSDDQTTSNRRPFVAFVADKENYSVYLINPTDIRYEKIVTLTGGNTDDGGGIMETGKSMKIQGVLEPRSFILLENSSLWVWGDYLVWYEADLYEDIKNKPMMVSFILPKYHFRESKVMLPVLNVIGNITELSPRKVQTTIQEKVKTMNMDFVYRKHEDLKS